MTKVDKRIPPTDDIISKCGTDDPESECKYFVRSKWTKTCKYLRFGFMCDRDVMKD